MSGYKGVYSQCFGGLESRGLSELSHPLRDNQGSVLTLNFDKKKFFCQGGFENFIFITIGKNEQYILIFTKNLIITIVSILYSVI